MSLVNYNFDTKDKCYYITVNKFAIQDIVLRRLPLGNEFTLRDISNAWNKMWHKNGGYIKNEWCPQRKYIQQALDDLVGTQLFKSYVSLKLTDGSVTESKYTRL